MIPLALAGVAALNVNSLFVLIYLGSAVAVCWISVRTQFPEPGKFIDVWMVNKRNKLIQYRLADVPAVVNASGLVLPNDSRFMLHQKISQITHWRYLPAPPSMQQS